MLKDIGIATAARPQRRRAGAALGADQRALARRRAADAAPDASVSELARWVERLTAHRDHGARARDGACRAAVMRVLVTGAGRLHRPAPSSHAPRRVGARRRSRYRPVDDGDIADPRRHVDAALFAASRSTASSTSPAIVSGAAEADYDAGRRVNLDATIALLERCRAQARRGGPVARFVYASSIAVFGTPLPARIDDATAPEPTLSYGTHKRACELLIDDCTRRGSSTAARCACRASSCGRALAERRAVGLQQRPDPRAARRPRVRVPGRRPTRRSGSTSLAPRDRQPDPARAGRRRGARRAARADGAGARRLDRRHRRRARPRRCRSAGARPLRAAAGDRGAVRTLAARLRRSSAAERARPGLRRVDRRR